MPIERAQQSEDSASRPLLSLPLLLGLGLFALSLTSGSILSDPDSYWHLAAGRWIMTEMQIPLRDAFSHSMPNASWTAHEWLSEVVLWEAYRTGGWMVVQLLAVACFAGTAGYLLRFLLRRMEAVHALILWVVCTAMLETHLLARPHVLVWPLIALWIGQLVEAGERQSGPPWTALFIIPFWANLHGSFIISIGIAGLLSADAVWQRQTLTERVAVAKPWILFLSATVLLMCLTPRGPGTLLHAISMMRQTVMLETINEWRSASFHQFQFLLLWIVGLLTFALSGYLRLSPWRLLFVGFFFYIALKHARYHSLLGLVSPFVLATPLANGLTELKAGSSQAAVGWLDRWFSQVARPARAVGLLIGVLVAAAIVVVERPWMPSAPGETIQPSAGLRAVRAAGLRGRVFNDYSYGGYLIFEGVPVFIDGRADMYGDAFLAAADTAGRIGRRGAAEALFSRYKIEWTFLKPNTPLVELLDHSTAWDRFYADSQVVVHVRHAVVPTSENRP